MGMICADDQLKLYEVNLYILRDLSDTELYTVQQSARGEIIVRHG